MTDLEFNIYNSKIVTSIQQAINLFSEHWKTHYGLFLHKEHLTRFVECTKAGFRSGFCTYALESVFETKVDEHALYLQNLKQIYSRIDACVGEPNHFLLKQLQETIEAIPFTDLLLLMGQRLSATSLRSVDALPPLKQTLFTACFNPFNTQMSTVVRAWEKHAERSEDLFWPKRKGSAVFKEEMMADFVEQFFTDWTWWNVYSHQKHKYVFELRIESGHGMRWTKNGEQFIGFLEPFIEHQE